MKQSSRCKFTEMGQSTVYFDNEMSGVWFDDRLSCILHTSSVYCFEMRMSRDGRLGFYLFVAKGGSTEKSICFVSLSLRHAFETRKKSF